MKTPRMTESEKGFALWLKKQVMLSDQIGRLQTRVEIAKARLQALVDKFGEVLTAKPDKPFNWDHLPPETFKQSKNQSDVRPN